MCAKRVALVSVQSSPTDPLEVAMSPLEYRVYAMKRLMFVSSMYFRLLRVKDPTPMELSRVNTRFQLASNNSAMKLPAAVSGWVWKKLDLDNIFHRYLKNLEDMTALTDEVLKQTPGWMKYGDGKRMHQDILSVFDSVAAG